jgi:hypothetical protein
MLRRSGSRQGGRQCPTLRKERVPILQVTKVLQVQEQLAKVLGSRSENWLGMAVEK